MPFKGFNCRAVRRHPLTELGKNMARRTLKLQARGRFAISLLLLSLLAYVIVGGFFFALLWMLKVPLGSPESFLVVGAFLALAIALFPGRKRRTVVFVLIAILLLAAFLALHFGILRA
jgi:hypothetical protein